MSQNQISASIIYKIREERSKRQDDDLYQPPIDSQKINFYLTYQEFNEQSCPQDTAVSKRHHKGHACNFPKVDFGSNGRKNKSDITHPKKITLNFDLFNPKRRAKDQMQQNSKSFHFQEMLMMSKEKYLSKIQKQNKKRSQRCKLISMFGLNIKAMEKSKDQKIERGERFTKRTEHKTKQTITQENQPEKTGKIKAKDDKKMSNIAITKRLSNPRQKAKSYVFQNYVNKQVCSIYQKATKMLLSNNIVLNSFGYYLNPQFLQNNNKFKFYVGNGNNKNLIISILKKRWWWTETLDISSANLVWTQLKHSPTIQRQQSNQISLSLNSMQFLRKKQGQEETDYLFKSNSLFFHNKLSHRLHTSLSYKQKKSMLNQLQLPQIVHNHFQHNFMLGNKNALFENISSYYKFKNLDVQSIIPLTFLIQNIQSKTFQQFSIKAKQSKNSVWIIKPGENSNRGNGIFVCKTVEEIKRKLSRKKNNHTYIIQKYITNLFLYQRRKFDIRTYLLMLTIGGVTKFLWYNEGYIRTSSQVFDLKDLSDFYIHLTNDAIQINNSNYGKYQDGNKITYSQFQRYLDNNYSDEKYKMKQLNENMKQLAINVVKATYSKINQKQKKYGFQLFGLDFIIDSSFKPWLLEVNTNPCLQLTSPILQRLIPRMLQNLFRLSVDSVFQASGDISKSKSHYIYQNCLQKNKFQLIFDSLFDRDQEWESEIKKEGEKLYEDENQIFQSDGVQIIAADY